MEAKILRVVTLILIVFFGLELFYLYFYKKSDKLSVDNSHKLAQLATPQSNSNVITSVSSYLANYDTSILTSSIIINKYQGKIVEVFDSSGVRNAFRYEKGLKIASNKDIGIENYFLLRLSDIPKLKVVNGNQEISFSNLQKGDNIEIEEKMDILAPVVSNRVYVVINKL